jgi:hypothetical protein
MTWTKFILSIHLGVENFFLPMVTEETTISLFTERFPGDVE